MNTSLLEAFRIIMQTGTVSGTADALGRSQSAVSRMLDRLEDELQIKLFERRKGRVVPTREAHALIEDVERAFISLSDLGTRARQIREGHESNLTLAVLPALGIDFLPRVVGRFSRLNPDIGVTSHVLASHGVEQWVANHQVELGLAETPFQRSGFETRVFIDEPYVLAMHAEHRLAELDLIRPSDLQDERVIQWTAVVAARRLFDELLQHAGVTIKSTAETSMSSAMVAMVRENLGVALIDPITARLKRDPQVVIRRFRPDLPCRIARMMPGKDYQRAVVDMFLGCAEEERDALLAVRDW
ncbi:LysR family transcriptional regulator [Paracoccus seriniphilus]|uniref:DNA-binding transcriptional regulator, LysR family n=1 Tax=Paracoccus seriniphilus TaxID=184748 RepID=A0A239Q4E9_9RHOB|nr:LysR family transcriptional regulator [Paracoccus seriniphilus]WCR15938.1 LysR family transcriptional regulator [Paracoccus seriniphilus]SNT76827.1 DNA-binding transcriptional regulator, LysR family [Paracoccus seriniphilus]